MEQKQAERDFRVKVAQETLKIMETGIYINLEGQEIDLRDVQSRAMKETYLYCPKQLTNLLLRFRYDAQQAKELKLTRKQKELSSFIPETKYMFENETTLGMCKLLADQNYENVCCLNFASAKNPGGGFLKGSTAQEESIARSSGLYNCIRKSSMYVTNSSRQVNCFYTHNMLFSSKVPVFRDDVHYQLFNNYYLVSIITSPAVNAGVMLKRKAKPEQIRQVMKERILYILMVSMLQEQKNIVLGLYGCGVFGNSLEVIAELFKETLKDELFEGKFEN
eukprot:Awhi_evm1s2225